MQLLLILLDSAALNYPARSPYQFDLDDVNRSLPGFAKRDQYPYPTHVCSVHHAFNVGSIET